MKVLGIWVAGFLFGYLCCCAVPYDGPFLGGLGCATLLSVFGAFRLAGCRAILPILAAPLFSLLAAALLWPLGFLPWKLVGALQPALVSMFFLQVVFLTVPGRVPLFTLLGQIALGVAVTDWAFTLWYPESTVWQRVSGCLVTVVYTVFLSILVAGLKRREGRKKEPPPAPPTPTTPARTLRSLAGSLENTVLHTLGEEVVRPCTMAYDRRPAYDRHLQDDDLLARIDRFAGADGTHDAVRAFLSALRAEIVDLRAGRDTVRSAEARQRATNEMLWALGLH